MSEQHASAEQAAEPAAKNSQRGIAERLDTNGRISGFRQGEVLYAGAFAIAHISHIQGAHQDWHLVLTPAGFRCRHIFGTGIIQQPEQILEVVSDDRISCCEAQEFPDGDPQPPAPVQRSTWIETGTVFKTILTGLAASSTSSRE